MQLELGDGDSLGLVVDGGIQRFCRRVGLLEKLQLDLKFRKGLLGLALFLPCQSEGLIRLGARIFCRLGFRLEAIDLRLRCFRGFLELGDLS